MGDPLRLWEKGALLGSWGSMGGIEGVLLSLLCSLAAASSSLRALKYKCSNKCTLRFKDFGDSHFKLLQNEQNVWPGSRKVEIQFLSILLEKSSAES